MVATFNSPHRLLPHQEDFQALADMGVAIIAAQENTDTDPKKNCPRGWKYYRPTGARSNVIYYDPAVVRATKKGHHRISSKKWRSLRHLVWVHFETGADPIRVASVHLPAFKNKNKYAAAEFLKQEPKVADWLDGGTWRVVAGDFNSTLPNRRWCPNVTRVGKPSRAVPSGPYGIKIDYVVTSKRGGWRPVKTLAYEPQNSDHKAVVVVLERTP